MTKLNHEICETKHGIELQFRMNLKKECKSVACSFICSNHLAFQSYKNELDDQLSQLFPTEYAEYKSADMSDGNHTNNGHGNNIVHNGNTNIH